MSFKLKARTYDWRDFFRLPFACEPLCTAAVIGQKLLTGLVNVLWIAVEARFIDKALACAAGQAELEDIYPLFAAMLLIIIWKRMGWNLGRIPAEKLKLSIQYQTRTEVVKKRSRIHYSLVEDSRAWELSQRVNKEMNRNISSMLTSTCDFLMAVVRILGVFLIIFTENIWLGVLMVLIMMPLVYFSVKSGGRIYKAFQEASLYEQRSDYLQGVMTGREAMEERTLFAYTDHLNREWLRQKEICRKGYLKADWMQELRKSGSGILTNLVSAVMVLFLIWELYKGRLGVGMFIALSKAVYDIISLMYNELGYSISHMSRYLAFFKDMEAFAGLSETEGTNDLPAAVPVDFESLELKHVSFRYPGSENYILKDVNLLLKRGQHYAFVGENGAGKTTLTKLFTGLYDEYEGKILLNGRNLRNIPPAEIKAFFSNVYQDFARFQDTAANNILIGDIRHMEDEEARKRMEEYTKKLGLYEEIERLPQGFDTPLGKLSDHGVDLSGGQWQRVAMARSLMNPAPVQVLDEPTASLDPVSESRLYEDFEKLSKGKTTIFISHRLGSTKLANHIFVLKEGSVSEEGTHERLMGLHGLYAQMYESQKSWYEEGTGGEQEA